MDKIQLIVADFEKHREGFPIWSAIYVRIAHHSFPDEQWWDVTSSILEMWANSINSLICGTVNCCTLDFMDGDYSILVERVGLQQVRASCLKAHNVVVFSDAIDLLYFARQILSAIEKLKNNYPSSLGTRTIQELIYAADKLRVTLMQYRARTM